MVIQILLFGSLEVTLNLFLLPFRMNSESAVLFETTSILFFPKGIFVFSR